MAEKRMFAKTIIDSDAFIDMPISSRLLYYDLAMRADDDGFVNSPKKIMKFIGASVDDMNVLITRKFIIPFESGVVVIKHWRIHNYIRKDTYKETPYKDEKSMLIIDENKAYKMKPTAEISDNSALVDEPSTQNRLDKIRLDKISVDKNSIDLFAAAKEKMRQHFNDCIYNAWISKIQLSSITENTITIIVKDEYSLKTIKENYLDRIKNIFDETFQKDLAINFEVEL